MYVYIPLRKKTGHKRNKEVLNELLLCDVCYIELFTRKI